MQTGAAPVARRVRPPDRAPEVLSGVGEIVISHCHKAEARVGRRKLRIDRNVFVGTHGNADSVGIVRPSAPGPLPATIIHPFFQRKPSASQKIQDTVVTTAMAMGNHSDVIENME